MAVKNPLVFLNKKDSSITKTFITNLFIGLVAFALFSGVAAIASAQEETDQQKTPAEWREARQQEIQDQREEQKALLDDRREAIREQVTEQRENVASRTEEVREKIQERKAVLSERIKNRILALADNVSLKMTAAINRLAQIIDRFEKRIDTLEARGVDGSAAQVKLDEATEYLDKASTILNDEVNNQVDATVGSDNPREAWAVGKAKFQEARLAIISAHQAIREALALLKQAVADAELGQGVSDVILPSEKNATTTE